MDTGYIYIGIHQGSLNLNFLWNYLDQHRSLIQNNIDFNQMFTYTNLKSKNFDKINQKFYSIIPNIKNCDQNEF